MSDPITEELFRNAISAIGDEMVLTIYRTAYSGVLKNIMDYSAAICDADGRLVAQGLSLPGHLCSIPVSLQAVLAAFGDDVHPGDIFINNDLIITDTSESNNLDELFYCAHFIF